MTREYRPHFAAYYRWLVLTHQLNIKAHGDSVLDVGCNDGYFLSRLAGQLRVGVDLDPCVPLEHRLLVLQADGCALPFASGAFGTVLAFDTIEHIQDPQAFVASILRVLAPGGCLWLSTPTDTAKIFPAWLNRRAMDSWGHQRPGHSVEDLLKRLPAETHVEATLWNATSLRLFYILLYLLHRLSPSLAQLGARLCYELDRHLPKGQDYIVLRATRREDQP